MPRILDDRVHDRDALLLAAAEAVPALAHHRGVAVGQRSDDGVDART